MNAAYATDEHAADGHLTQVGSEEEPTLYWLDEGALVPRKRPEEDGRTWMEVADDWLAARREEEQAEEQDRTPQDDEQALSSLSWL